MVFPDDPPGGSSGSATLQFLWSFLPGAFPVEDAVSLHRLGGVPVLQGLGAACPESPSIGRGLGQCKPWSLLLFIQCQSLSSPWGLMGPGNH